MEALLKQKFTSEIERLKENLSLYENELSFRVIEKDNSIIEVGFLTVSTNENGKVILHNALFPTQFNEKAVNEILKSKFTNVKGEIVEPKIYSRNEWYEARKQEIANTIELFEKSPTMTN